MTQTHTSLLPSMHSTPHLNHNTPAEKRHRAIKGSISFQLWKKQGGIHADVFTAQNQTMYLPRHSPPLRKLTQRHLTTLPCLNPHHTLLLLCPHSRKHQPFLCLTSTQQQYTPRTPWLNLLCSKHLTNLTLYFIKSSTTWDCRSRNRGFFSYHPISSLHPKAHLLNAIWSYKRKQAPTGTLKKYKSRLCINGSCQQYWVNYWDTYTPVIAWSTVHLVLSLSSILNLKSSQADFDQAFRQFPIAEDVYMKIPQGWYIHNSTMTTVPTSNSSKHYMESNKSPELGIGTSRLASPTRFQGIINWPLPFAQRWLHPLTICWWLPPILLKWQHHWQHYSTTFPKKYLNDMPGSPKTFLDFVSQMIHKAASIYAKKGHISSILNDLNLDKSFHKPTPAIHVLYPDSPITN